jgi:hypothetical protein
LGSEPGLLFFCLGGLVVIADPIITSESPDTKTQPAYADRASEKVCLVLFVPVFRQGFPGRCVIQAPKSVPGGTFDGFS